jgi:hypothetical protein
MKRTLYYDILLVGFTFIFIYYSFRMFLPYESAVHMPMKYFGYFKDVFLFFIILYEALNAEKVVKWICLLLLPFVFVGRTFIIMHWPFGLSIFIVSTLSIWILLVIGVLRSKTEVMLRILILLYPLTRVVFHRIFFYHLQIPWWFVDYSIIGLIAIALTVKRIKSFNKKSKL